MLGRLLLNEAGSYVELATALVRRFLPPQTANADALGAALWLIGGCSIFVRNREHLGQPPFNMQIDDDLVDHLTDLITRLAAAGLQQELASAAKILTPRSNAAGVPYPTYLASASAASRMVAHTAATSACSVAIAPIETRTIQRPSSTAGVR